MLGRHALSPPERSVYVVFFTGRKAKDALSSALVGVGRWYLVQI